MKTSEDINEVAKALCLAQQAMKPASKDSINPHYKSKFSDFSSIWEAIRVPITSNGLTILQDVTTLEKNVCVSTRIIHTSGQWIEFGPLSIPLNKYDAHGIGSATTYAKRYALSAALGVVSSEDDDDGNAAQANPHKIDTTVKEEIVEYITDEQNEIIETLLGDDGRILDWFRSAMIARKIPSQKLLPANLFTDVCEAIKKKSKELNNKN